ncbi:MAG: quinol monooxygenase YgiN [Bacteroidia bacterium]
MPRLACLGYRVGAVMPDQGEMYEGNHQAHAQCDFSIISEKVGMTIGVLATITVAEGKNAEFEKVFLELIEQVRANEPGNNFYSLNRSMSDPQVYKVMEQYVDGDALDVHSKSDHFRAANKQLAGLVAGAPDIELLESF